MNETKDIKTKIGKSKLELKYLIVIKALKGQGWRIKELEKIQCDESCKIWFRERDKYKKRIAGLEAKLKEKLKPFEELRKECIADMEHMIKKPVKAEDAVDVILLNMIDYFKKKHEQSLTPEQAAGIWAGARRGESLEVIMNHIRKKGKEAVKG